MNRRDCIRFLLAAAPAGLAAQTAAPPLILVLGDSISAEYGIARGSGWVALLEQRLAREQIAARVLNASVSGDTTAGGRSRLPALLKAHRPAVVVIELGGNDALRGLSLEMTEANLTAMTQAAQATGMMLSPLRATASAPARLRSAANTVAPSRANSSVAARPIPDAAPVITTLFPANRMAQSSPFRFATSLGRKGARSTLLGLTLRQGEAPALQHNRRLRAAAESP